MATAADLRRYALSLPGVVEAPHFDRTAFKVDRIFATLAADAQTANLMLTADEQSYQCETSPEAFRPLDNGWGLRGATMIVLKYADQANMADAVNLAYAHAVGKTRR